MYWEYIRFALAALCILIGLFITITGIFGFYKYKFILNRMHSAAIIDTLGLFFIVLGLIILKGFTNSEGGFDVTWIKLAAIVCILWVASPVSSHLIAKIIYMTDSNTDKETVEIDVEVDGGENGNE